MLTQLKNKNKGRPQSHEMKVNASFQRVLKQEIFHKEFVLNDVFSVSSSGAGTVSTVRVLDPSACQDWGKMSAYYDEFRVKAVKLFILSSQQYSVTKLCSLVCVYMDNDNATAEAYNTAIQRAYKVFVPSIFGHQNGGLKHLQFSRPTDKSSPIVWHDIANPSTEPGSICFVSQVASLSTSTNYFEVAIEYLIEARGAR